MMLSNQCQIRASAQPEVYPNLIYIAPHHIHSGTIPPQTPWPPHTPYKHQPAQTPPNPRHPTHLECRLKAANHCFALQGRAAGGSEGDASCASACRPGFPPCRLPSCLEGASGALLPTRPAEGAVPHTPRRQSLVIMTLSQGNKQFVCWRFSFEIRLFVVRFLHRPLDFAAQGGFCKGDSSTVLSRTPLPNPGPLFCFSFLQHFVSQISE